MFGVALLPHVQCVSYPAVQCVSPTICEVSNKMCSLSLIRHVKSVYPITCAVCFSFLTHSRPLFPHVQCLSYHKHSVCAYPTTHALCLPYHMLNMILQPHLQCVSPITCTVCLLLAYERCVSLNTCTLYLSAHKVYLFPVHCVVWYVPIHYS
jgi:hypothetical protein